MRNRHGIIRTAALLLVLAACLFAACMGAAAEEWNNYNTRSADGFVYGVQSDGTAVILSYNGDRVRELAIPAWIDGYQVTAVDHAKELMNTWDRCEKIIVPEGVVRIGDSAFWGSTAYAFELPQSLRTIGERAFYSCGSLAAVTIPGGVEDIGDEAFSECRSLRSVTVSEGVTRIGKRMFGNCEALTELVLPQSVTMIDDEAFQWCNSLDVTYTGENIAWGKGVYSGCGMKTFTIPDNVVQIGSNPFCYAKKLVSIVVSPDHPTLAVIDGVLFSKEDKRLISYPAGLKDSRYEIPEGVRIVGGNAFMYTDNLKEIVVPSSVQVLEPEAFYGTRAKTITFYDGDVYLEDDRFMCLNTYIEQFVVSPTHPTLATVDDCLYYKPYKCLLQYPAASSRSEYAIREGTEIIGSYSFYGANNLTEVTIPGSVVTIRPDAFYLCDKLTTVRLSEGLLTIGDGAFSNCESLVEITIPRSVQFIDEYAFLYSGNRIRFTVYAGSCGEQYCMEHGYRYTVVN